MMKCENCPGFRKDIDININIVTDTEKKIRETVFFQVNIPLNSMKSMIKIISTHHVLKKDCSSSTFYSLKIERRYLNFKK